MAPRSRRTFSTGRILRKQTAVASEQIDISRLVRRRCWQFDPQVSAARNTNFLADEPIDFGGKRERGIADLTRRCEFLHQQHFILIAVGLDIAWIVRLQRNRPPDFASFPTSRQVPFNLSGETSVPRKFPVGMPAGCHSKQHPDREWLARDNCVGIGQQLCFYHPFSLISLALPLRRETKDRQPDDRMRSKSNCRFHSLR